jgi:hypothetical protein
MFNWLHTLPNVGIGVLILGLGLSVSTLIPFFIRRRFGLELDEKMGRGVEDSFKLLTSTTMLLLAFCLVRVQGDHRNLEDLVTREATIMFKLDRALAGYGGEEANALRGGLKLYAKSTVDIEWPLLVKSERSEATSELLALLVEGCRELDPETALQQMVRAEVLGTVAQMSDVREARLSASRLFLPHYYWQALGVAFVLLTLFGWIQSPLLKLVTYVSGVTVGVCLLFTLLVVTEGLFVGESRVTAEAIARIIPALGK